MSYWTTSTLEEGLERLIDYRGKSPPKSASGIPVISAKVVKTRGLLQPIEQKIAADYYSTWMTRGLPEVGDVVLTTEGPLGEVIQLDSESVKYALGQRVVCLRGKPGILDNTFLRYLLASPSQQEVLASYATGTTVAGISQKALRSVPISYPPFEEQRRIGKLLSALDDKIDLNRRMNETLEAMAQAIFRDWFVDFGPVRRKLAGITDPVAIMGGLTPDPVRAAELAALFPNRFGEDEVPVGWTDGTLSDWAEVNPESWSTRNHPDWVNYVDLSNTKWGTIEATEKLPWASAPSRARRVIRPFDTIVATTRPGNGSYAYISQDGYTASTGFAVMRPKQPQFSQFVYCAATDPLNIARLAQLADGHGGAYPAVNPGEVGASPIINCGTEVVEAFEALAQPLRTKIEHSKVESRTLAETRDYLLPRLMSGEVRVGDVAQELAA